MKRNYIKIGNRKVGPEYPPLVIAEIGINHNGSIAKARRMIKDAQKAGAECVKFQAHVVEDEMVPVAKKIVPGHAKESIWDIMKRAAFSAKQDRELKRFVEKLGMIYLSTPFSRAGADRLKRMNVSAYKIGSGECNNYPLIEHIASFRKPVILSTGMNNLASVSKAVKILRKYNIPYALLHCTSMYPTPYNKVRLGAITQLQKKFPDAVVGLSDHSLGNYTGYAAVALGASIIEKHFTSTREWPGPDIALSVNPVELKELVAGTKAVYESLGGSKDILPEEKGIIDFAYACVVSIKNIKKGEKFTKENIWVKRPGTGEIKAEKFSEVLGKIAQRDIVKDSQLTRKDVKF